MKKYTFYVTDIVCSTYEIFDTDKDSAEDKLEQILSEESYINDDRHYISTSEITFIEESDSFTAQFDGQNLVVQTDKGKASMDLSEIIDKLLSNLDGGNENEL